MNDEVFIQIRCSRQERDRLHELAKSRQKTGSYIIRKWINDSWRRRFYVPGSKN